MLGNHFPTSKVLETQVSQGKEHRVSSSFVFTIRTRNSVGRGSSDEHPHRIGNKRGHFVSNLYGVESAFVILFTRFPEFKKAPIFFMNT